MNELDPLERIKELCSERHWSYYQLSKAAGIPYSTLNTMLNKQNMPSIPTLQKLCRGFGITLSEFFDPGRGQNGLTSEQKRCLSLFTALPAEDRELVMAFMKRFSKR